MTLADNIEERILEAVALVKKQNFKNPKKIRINPLKFEELKKKIEIRMVCDSAHRYSCSFLGVPLVFDDRISDFEVEF